MYQSREALARAAISILLKIFGKRHNHGFMFFLITVATLYKSNIYVSTYIESNGFVIQ